VLKQLFARMFGRAHAHNTANIVRLARSYGTPRDRVCDFGTGDGIVASEIFGALRPGEVCAIESYGPNVATLRDLGWTVVEDDLNAVTSLASDQFDLIVSNQVIEHLYDTDIFIEEIFRTLRPGGVVVLSTENLASWHNVASLAIGWQPFSLTNITAKAGGVGNPLAFYAGSDGACFPMQHHRLMTPRALTELLSAHGFGDIRRAGAGYYPFPSSFGAIDVAHAHFICVAARKPPAAPASG